MMFNAPSEMDVQFSSGSVTGKRLPCTSILVVLRKTTSSAVMSHADGVISSAAI